MIIAARTVCCHCGRVIYLFDPRWYHGDFLWYHGDGTLYCCDKMRIDDYLKATLW